MRKRRGVDVMIVAGLSCSGDSTGRNGDDKTDKDAPEHEMNLEGNTTRLMRA
jgi:hypothetical protein